MHKQFSSYQLNGLTKLIAFKEHFKKNEDKHSVKASQSQKNQTRVTSFSQQFIEIFCGHDLADTDYAIIQTELFKYDTIEQWINQVSIETILKYTTYIIWTDKIVEGYFGTKIKDQTLYSLLNRLEILLRTKWDIN